MEALTYAIAKAVFVPPELSHLQALGSLKHANGFAFHEIEPFLKNGHRITQTAMEYISITSISEARIKEFEERFKEKIRQLLPSMFEPLKDKILAIGIFSKVLEGDEDKIILDEEKWDQQSFCTFSSDKEEVIQMDIGQTKEERVTYRLYPLK